MAINNTTDSMAVHVLVHLAIANLKHRRWDNLDIEAWLDGIDEPLKQEVRDKINEII